MSTHYASSCSCQKNSNRSRVVTCIRRYIDIAFSWCCIQMFILRMHVQCMRECPFPSSYSMPSNMWSATLQQLVFVMDKQTGQDTNFEQTLYSIRYILLLVSWLTALISQAVWSEKSTITTESWIQTEERVANWLYSGDGYAPCHMFAPGSHLFIRKTTYRENALCEVDTSGTSLTAYHNSLDVCM